MRAEDTYDSLEEVLSNIPDNYKIMEETIDLEIQKAYFRFSKTITIDSDKDQAAQLIRDLNEPGKSGDELKTLLIKLAMLDSVKAYRAIEAYHQHAEPGLKEWALLSLQQSRMLLQSTLTGQQQVFISTGLGGKADKLRYFLIFPYHLKDQLHSIQAKTLEDELHFFIERYNGEVESVDRQEKFSTATVLLPLRANIPAIIQELIDECNQYGNFLSDDVLITNMKKFTQEEILKLLKNDFKK
ncbi:MAG: hypothetical protein JXR22_13445 [Prolixibacteraceae bacterium]|nr:hypothetical protein [Prolixibacteraceae bacterium]